MGNVQTFGFWKSVSLIVPAVIFLALSWILAQQVQGISFSLPSATPAQFAIETVIVAPRTYSYRRSGKYQFRNTQVVAPMVEVVPNGPVEIMKYGVTADRFALCVNAGACRQAKRSQSDVPDAPATNISFYDAQDYAAWLSDETGEEWRLPTDIEWAQAAGSQFVDDVVDGARGENDPSALWLSAYTKNAELRAAADPIVKAQGFYGENEFGVADMHSNVWEWTSTCYNRTTLDAKGAVVSVVENCGVRAVEGAHRAYVSGFIRDPKGGGCSAGVPPDHLGFRLVKEAHVRSLFDRLFMLILNR